MQAKKDHRLNLYLSEANTQKVEEITRVTGLKKAQLWTQFIELCLDEFVEKYRIRLEQLGKAGGR